MHDRHGGRGRRRFAHDAFPPGEGGRGRRDRQGSERGGERRGGGGRRGRVLDHGDLRWLALALIAQKPRHGYEIIKAVEDRMGGRYSPSPGVVYPTLTLLEELGHVTVSDAGGGRRLHAITAEGSVSLAESRVLVEAAEGRLAAAAGAVGGPSEPPAPVIRAMENLKLALRLRLAGKTPDQTAIDTIAAALDAAALAVERA